MQLSNTVPTSEYDDFVSAQCPSCNGPLRVPADRANVICMYCGADVLLHPVSQQVTVTNLGNVENWLTLAQAALDAENYEESFNFYTKVLEVYPENSEAWFGKGVAAGWQSKLANVRLREMVTAFEKATLYAQEDVRPELGERIANETATIARAVFQLSWKHTNEFVLVESEWAEHLSRSEEVLNILLSAHTHFPGNPSILKTIIEVCTFNIRGISYENGWRFLSFGAKARAKTTRSVAVRKMEILRPNYRPPSTGEVDIRIVGIAVGVFLLFMWLVL